MAPIPYLVSIIGGSISSLGIPSTITESNAIFACEGIDCFAIVHRVQPGSQSVTPGVERLQTGACRVVVVVLSRGITGSEIGRGI
jgi:hypothetical protein